MYSLCTNPALKKNLSKNIMSQYAMELMEFISMNMITAIDLMTSVELEVSVTETTGILISVPIPVKILAMAALPAQTLNTSDASKTTSMSASTQTFTAITILTVTMLRMNNMETVWINIEKHFGLRNSLTQVCHPVKVRLTRNLK